MTAPTPCACRSLAILLLVLVLVSQGACASARVETYLEYVGRSVSRADPELARALPSDEAFLTMDALQPLAAANIAFLDGLVATEQLASSALIAVPLLVQLVRDWSASGELVRRSSYRPIVDSLVPFLLHVRAPRILVPGSGTGRLPSMLAERLRDAQIVALDPDEHAQLAAAFMLTGGNMQLIDAGGDDGGVEGGGREGGPAPRTSRGATSAAPPSIRLPFTIYPSLHVSTNWAHSAHRLAGVALPDVPLATLHHVEDHSNVTFAVGTLEEAGEAWLDGGALDDGPRRGFDAVGTSFVLDVLPDLLLCLRALHAMLRESGGLWANLGPLAFPEPHEGLLPPHGAQSDDARRAAPLTASQTLALVRSAGFEVLEERLHEGCEYNVLPHRLERTVRTCLFFLARPATEGAVPSAPRDAAAAPALLRDEL